jgi:hypothetical protein
MTRGLFAFLVLLPCLAFAQEPASKLDAILRAARNQVGVAVTYQGPRGQQPAPVAVADPYYGGEAGFAITWADVSAGAKGLAGFFTKQDGSSR